ncbi:hypothetical protein HYX05_04340 [Candidatus Woesearchaeota archaeon]|nr:hypothetical protein [Candidatus Woesearchaeota archaeon]
MANKLIDIIATILLFIGMLIAFSSHAFHARIGLEEETSHVKHVIYGMVIAVIGLCILIYNNKALKFRKKS